MPADVVSSAGQGEITVALRDGFEVHRAALGRGLDVLLLPRQVMMASTGAATTELSFVHGVPRTSSLSAVTFAQDKRMRRALLTTAGLPVPKGGSYSVGKGFDYARRLIDRIGYPVVVKPAVGDNTIETRAGITDDEQLAQAIDYLRTPPAERPTHTRAAYALTLLAEPEEAEDGRVLVPSSYRFLVEQQVSGEYLRLLVLDDEVRSVVRCPGGPWGADPGEDVTATAHASLLRLARDAVRAVPGLAIAAVDVVATGHEREIAEQQASIVELSERPWLAVHARIDEGLSRRLGEDILTAHAAEVDLEPAEPRDDITVDVHIEGLTESAGSVAAYVDAARALGLDAKLDVTDEVEGIADGTVHGQPTAIAWLAETLIDGTLDGHRAMLIDQKHQT